MLLFGWASGTPSTGNEVANVNDDDDGYDDGDNSFDGSEGVEENHHDDVGDKNDDTYDSERTDGVVGKNDADMKQMNLTSSPVVENENNNGNDNPVLNGNVDSSSDETERPPQAVQIVDEIVEQYTAAPDDLFPLARDFLADMNDDVMTIITEIVDRVDSHNDDENNIDNHHDDATVATQRTTVTRVQPVSGTFRPTNNKDNHPHQTIFDILDRNFEEMGDGGSYQIGHRVVKLCFVAFVSIFTLPSEPTNGAARRDVESGDNIQNHETIIDHDNNASDDSKGLITQQQSQDETAVLQRVPLSVAFALWNKVLEESGHASPSNDDLSYIRSTLVLLGMLDLASIDRDRDDGVSQSGQNNRSIECLAVHDHIHQQYGEYLAWGDHDKAFRSLIEVDSRRWSEAVMHESKLIGSNQFTLRMLPLHTMRTANRMQETFDLLNDRTFVRRRIRVLGSTAAATAHISDIDELLALIETNMKCDEIVPEPIDEVAGLLGAYQQVFKYCLHETEELTKSHRDEAGKIQLSKTAMYKTAEIGNALHLLGASLGGYGFFDKEMEYYKEALRVKTLAVNGNIEKSVAVSDTLHSIGFSLDNAGKRDEALECYDKALMIRYECLGDDDLRIAETQHNKGALLCEEDRSEEAMECLEEALRIRESHYGEEHESCADTMQWMGNCLRKHGDPTDALDYFKFALAIKRQRLGIDHIDVANTLFNTAVLLDDIEKFDLSFVAYRESLRIRKLILGDTNQEVADTLFCMGNVAVVVENHIEALGFYEESIKIREDLIRADHPAATEFDDELLFLANPTLPSTDVALQYKKLNESFEESLPLTKLIMGTDHSKVYESLNRMGEIYMKLHDWDNAIGSFQGALRVKQSNVTHGQDDLEIAALLQRKGEAHLYKNEFIRAKTTFESAIQIRRKIQGKEDCMHIASSTCCLGVVYYYLNDFSHAKLLFQECYRIQIKLSGEDDACIVRSLCWLGRQHQKVKEPQKALERYMLALQRCKSMKASIDYRLVVMILHEMGNLYGDAGVNIHEITPAFNVSALPPEPAPGRPNILHENATDAEHHRKACLRVVRTMDRNVVEIVVAATEIALYDSRQRSSAKKINVEGSLLVIKRSDAPFIKLTVLNRSLSSILEAPVTASFQLLIQTPFLMFKDNPSLNDFHCIRFPNVKNLDEVALYLEQVVKQEISLKCYNEEINLIHSKFNVEETQTIRMLANAHRGSGLLYKERGDTKRSIEHLELVLELTMKCDGDESLSQGEIYDHLGMLYVSRSDFELAKQRYSSAYSVYEKTIGRDDLTMSDCAFRLAGVLEALNSTLALDFYKESLRVHRLNMTDDNERVGDILCCIARILLRDNDYKDALECLEEALSIRRRLLGDCSDVAETYHNLAKTYSEMTQHDKALIFYRESVRIYKKSISTRDAFHKVSMDMAQCATFCSQFQLAIDCYTDCLQETKSLNNNETDAAMLLQRMGEIHMNNLSRYDDAKKLFLDALEILRCDKDEEGRANEHITNLLMLTAHVHGLAKDYDYALDYYEELITLLQPNMPKNENLVADCLHAMADILSTMENPDYELAIEKLSECLDIKKKLFGLDDERVVDVIYTLATIYQKAGRHEKATESLSQVLRSFKMKNNKAGMVKVHTALARLKASKGTENPGPERSAAIECYEEALNIRRQIMSLDDIDLATILYEYASLLCMNNEHTKALPFLDEALRIQKSKNGMKDERVACILLRMAEVYVHERKFEASLVSLEQFLLIRASLGLCDSADDVDVDLGLCHYLLATTHFAREDYQKAISSYGECLTIRQNKFGLKSLECAAVYNDLGAAFGKVGDFDKATESLVEALKIRKTELGKNSLDCGHSVYNLAQIHISMGNKNQALNCLDEVIRVYSLFGVAMVEKRIEASELKGDVLCEVEKYDTAISMFEECLDLVDSSEDNKNISHSNPEQGGRLNYKLGRALAKIGDFDEAFNSYREAISIFSRVLGKGDLCVGEVMYDVGLLLVSQGGDDSGAKALECYNEMIRIYSLQGKGRGKEVANALVQKSNLLADCTEYDEAGSLLDDAIDIYKESLDDDAIEVAMAMLSYGKLHDSQGNNDDALVAFDEALRIFLIRLGEDDVHVSFALSQMGIIHAKRQEYSDAVDKFKTALKIRVSSGEQNMDVADSVFRIGQTLSDWGNEEEAYQYFQQALKLYNHLHGDDDISVAKCQQKLGLIYWNRKDVDQSLKSFLHALRIYEQEVEEDMDIMLATIYRGIGDCYYNKGEYDRSLENFARCLRLQKKLLGDDCIEMAPVCYYIGLIYQKKERYEEAMNFHSKAMLINENHYGKGSQECAPSDLQISKVFLALQSYEESVSRLHNHIKVFCDESHDCEDLGEVYHSLGLAQSKLGTYEESISSLNKALDMMTKVLGESHLNVAETRLDLAKILEECGNIDEAIGVYDHSITALQAASGVDSRVIASAYSRLGTLFEEKGNIDASLHSYKQALKMYSENSPGSDSRAVAETLFNIGKIYDQMGNNDKANSCFSECVKIYRSNDEECAIIGIALGHVAKNYARKKQYAKAVELSTESLRLQKQFSEAADIAESLVDLGNILKSWGKADQAVQFYDEALRTYEEAVGLDAIAVAVCRHNIGILKKTLGESEVALRYFGEALRIHRLNEGDNSLDVANNLFQIGQIYDSFGKKEKSLKCFEECCKIRKDILGVEHLDVLAAERYRTKAMKYNK